MKLNVALAATAIVLASALGGLAAEAQQRRTPLGDQPDCALCIVGTPVVQWSGASGSFQVDRVDNRGTQYATWPWSLQVVLESTYPDPDSNYTIGDYEFSDRLEFAPLPAGGSLSKIDSGPIAFHGNKVPAGEYWMAIAIFTKGPDGRWGIHHDHDYVVMADKVLCDGSSCVVKGTSPPLAHSVTRLLPIVVDVSNGSAHFTSEMALTNNTWRRLKVSMLYTASLGSKEGSGTVTDSLAPGEQRRIPDVLSYLRETGLAIPSPEEQPSQGGTLLVTFEGSEAIEPRLVSVIARTAALTSAPHPVGRAGLAYSGLLDTDTSTSSLTLFGLRSSATDRTNVAVFNTSGDPVTLKVTVHSGSGDGRSVVFREAETLPPYGWLQYGSAQILDGNGITTGWVTVERTSQTGAFSAYAVINDNVTNDGSFVPPVGGAVAGSTLTVPVLPATRDSRTELILANKSASTIALTLNWVADEGFYAVAQSMTIPLGPREERLIPDAIDFLRKNSLGAGDDPYIGAVRFIVSGTAAENVFVGTRTASQSPAGGQFGLFTPAVYSGQEASTEAYLYGLRSDSENRTSVAVVNTGTDSDGPVLLQLQPYDGDGGGAPRGHPVNVWASPGDLWMESFLRWSVANGWVKITRMFGTAPWFAYGIVHDGGKPGERTGDGAYVPMVK